MQGYSALWLPDIDHASAVTEARAAETMRKGDITKEKIGRKGFLGRAWDRKEKYGGAIIDQLKKLGCSCG